MKIKKDLKKLQESKLNEADELGIIDPDDSISEIADEISDSIETASGGEETVSDAAADAAAAEIKDAASDVGAESAVLALEDDNEYLGVENKITRVLDKALKGALRDQRRNTKHGHNVLISGLPGSGKTASIEDWARTNGINLVEVNAKNNDLEAYINGYTVKDPDDPRFTTQAFSKNLRALDQPRSVLFLDEYNRQVKQNIRASLYTLINNHKIVGDGPNGMYEFKNMLFTIAAINPSIPTDKGASPLNDAEKTRFVHKLMNMDSDSATTIEYLTKHYMKLIKKLDSSSEFYREDLEAYLRTMDIGIYVMSHPLFSYDTDTDLVALAKDQKTMLNQRSFVEGLNEVDGDVEEFKEWIRESSDFLKKSIDMLLDILRDYVKPSFETLCAEYEVEADKKAIAAATPAEPTVEPKSPDLEDDDDFFPAASAKGTVRAKNPYEVDMAIASALKDW
jgi:hypothetical protein